MSVLRKPARQYQSSFRTSLGFIGNLLHANSSVTYDHVATINIIIAVLRRILLRGELDVVEGKEVR
jgi:hypothetical protein